MHNVLEALHCGLVVSCQPVVGGALDSPEIVACFARAAVEGGACGLRIEGIENLKAVRRAVNVPIIGLVKSDRSDTEIRITSSVEDVRALGAEGADIIAFDATQRVRPEPLSALFEAVKDQECLAMADCSSINEARQAAQLGCEILGSTLAGYTCENTPIMPDLDLIKAMKPLGKFIVAEGRYNTPQLAAQATHMGADAVVVGSAITRPEHITSWYAQSIKEARLTCEITK